VAKPIARVWGTALVPGVSRNGRLYTADHVRQMVEAAQPALAAGALTLTRRDGDAPPPDPIGARSHHAAEDDSLRLLGRVTALTLNERDEALFELDLANTSAGRDLLELIDTEDGPAFLSGVSIRGYWGSEPREVDYEGRRVTTGDALILQGLDFTQSPGVPGAGVSRVERLSDGAPRESVVASGRAIYESVQEAHVTTAVTETAPEPAPEPTPPVTYADPGYQPDRAKRWPLDSRPAAVEAWSALSATETARDYTAAQLKRARGRTVKALERHGVQVTTEGHLRTEGPVSGSVLEMWPSVDGDGGYEVSLHVGPLRVSVASYCVDPHDLDRISRQAASAAADCLSSVMSDPDAGALPATPRVTVAAPVESRPAPLDTEGDMDDDQQTEEAGKVPPQFAGHQFGKGGKGGKPKGKAGADDSDDEDEDDTDSGPDGKGDKKMPAFLKDKLGKDAADDDEDDDEDDAKAKKAKKSSTTKEAAVADTSTIEETAEQRVERIVAERVAAEQAKRAEEARIEALVAEKLAAAQQPAVTETEDERIARLVEAKLAEAGAAAVVQETEEQRIQRLVDARVTAAIQTSVERNGAPARTGFVAGGVATESVDGYPAGWPTMPDGSPKAVHQLTESERNQHATPMLADYVEDELKRHRARALGL
jgi:hypothetical protein